MTSLSLQASNWQLLLQIAPWLPSRQLVLAGDLAGTVLTIDLASRVLTSDLAGCVSTGNVSGFSFPADLTGSVMKEMGFLQVSVNDAWDHCWHVFRRHYLSQAQQCLYKSCFEIYVLFTTLEGVILKINCLLHLNLVKNIRQVLIVYYAVWRQGSGHCSPCLASNNLITQLFRTASAKKASRCRYETSLHTRAKQKLQLRKIDKVCQTNSTCWRQRAQRRMRKVLWTRPAWNRTKATSLHRLRRLRDQSINQSIFWEPLGQIWPFD